MSLYRSSTRVQATSQQPAPAMGVTARGSFSCEARCFCPLGDDVWVGERSGQISIRSARTGDVLETITLPFSKGLFASVMRVVNQEMWIGTTDGRLIAVDVNTRDVLAELVNPETERNGEVFDICAQGNTLFTGMSSCRVCEWDTTTKTFVKSYLLSHAVHCVLAQNSVLYCGDTGGKVTQFDMQSSEIIATCGDSHSAVTAMILEEATRTLWCGRANGEIDVLAVEPNLARVETIRDAHARINSLLQVGGKVWAGGLEKTLFVFHAHTRKLLGKLKDHSAFIFNLGKLYTMETARVWSMSNDKTVTVYDGEGFFESIKGAGQGGHHAEVAELHAVIQTMKMDKQLLERQLSVERDKVLLRDNDVDRITQEMNEQTLKLHALQHVADAKEERMQAQSQDQSKLLDEIQNLTKRVGELTVQLNSAEQDKARLRGDVAKVQEELSRARSQVTEKTSMAALAETERRALHNDKDRVQYALSSKEKETISLGEELRRSRDQLNVKALDLQRRDNELEMVKRRMADLERERDGLVGKGRSLEEARRRMEDSVILRENEVKELLAQLNTLQGQKHTTSRDLAALTQVRQAEVHEAQKLQDNFVLRSHEFEVLTKDRQNLHESLEFEKKQVLEARNNEMKLRMQNDELRRQLDTEKNNVKLLEDQYTIFQFVINSRGELVSSIWSLYNKMSNAQKALTTLENNVKRFDPTKDKVTLKREWKEQLVDRSATSHKELKEVARQVEYIVCNYFSEYEKMHLGISSAKFPPDTNRQPIVGDQLLTKLRDVTLMKQVPKPGSAASNHGASYMTEASLPPSGYTGKQQAHPVNTLQTQNYMNLSQISATGPADGASPAAVGYSVLGGPPPPAAMSAGAGTPASSIHASSGILPSTGMPAGQLLGVGASGTQVTGLYSANPPVGPQFSQMANLGPLPPPENRPVSATSVGSALPNVGTPPAPTASSVPASAAPAVAHPVPQPAAVPASAPLPQSAATIPYSVASPNVPAPAATATALPQPSTTTNATAPTAGVAPSSSTAPVSAAAAAASAAASLAAANKQFAAMSTGSPSKQPASIAPPASTYSQPPAPVPASLPPGSYGNNPAGLPTTSATAPSSVAATITNSSLPPSSLVGGAYPAVKSSVPTAGGANPLTSTTTTAGTSAVVTPSTISNYGTPATGTSLTPTAQSPTKVSSNALPAATVVPSANTGVVPAARPVSGGAPLATAGAYGSLGSTPAPAANTIASAHPLPTSTTTSTSLPTPASSAATNPYGSLGSGSIPSTSVPVGNSYGGSVAGQQSIAAASNPYGALGNTGGSALPTSGLPAATLPGGAPIPASAYPAAYSSLGSAAAPAAKQQPDWLN